MKNGMILLGLIVAATLSAGCDKRAAPPERPTTYDKELDGPSSVITVDMDPRIAEDQTRVSQAAEIERDRRMTSATTTQPAGAGGTGTGTPAGTGTGTGTPAGTGTGTGTPAGTGTGTGTPAGTGTGTGTP